MHKRMCICDYDIAIEYLVKQCSARSFLFQKETNNMSCSDNGFATQLRAFRPEELPAVSVAITTFLSSRVTCRGARH